MLTVGDALPGFRLPALLPSGQRADVGIVDGASLAGKWLALLYWPMDFALFCGAERRTLARLAAGFSDAATQFLGIALSADTAGQPGRWRGVAAGELPFPVLVDTDGQLVAGLGLDPDRVGCSIRATFIVDPGGIIRWASVSDQAAGRSLREAAEVLRTLQGQKDPSEHATPDGLIAMCAWCRRVRDHEGWHAPEAFIRRRTGSEFTHGICRDCLHEQRPR
jgi:peroxiredoxin (alkyl hydroperoxide reductase subunit C)